MVKTPHPIPYQGSKRKLAPIIFEHVKNKKYNTLYEPFAGRAAFTIFAAKQNLAKKYVIGEISPALAELWNQIINDPYNISRKYEQIWLQQENNPNHYFEIRELFNQDQDPAKLLYLLARCVKNAARYNSKGEFNQSYDKRRKGTKPLTMKKSIIETSEILKNKTTVKCADYKQIVNRATTEDLIYLDPPYQGISEGKNSRYIQKLDRNNLIETLNNLADKNIPYILSYDGRTGTKTYGDELPYSIQAVKHEINAGKSSQATLNGEQKETIESLYIANNI